VPRERLGDLTSDMTEARERGSRASGWWRTQESHLARHLKCASPVEC